MSADSPSLKAQLFESLRSRLDGEGFSYRKQKDAFIRRRADVTDFFQLVCLTSSGGWRIQPNIAVRVERVEEIFHRTSGFEARYQKDTPTIGGSVGAITRTHNSDVEFRLEANSDVLAVADELAALIRSIGLPYFERFHSIDAIDRELNDRPTQRTPHRAAPWLRCSTGLIVAKLVNRPNYQALAEIYAALLSQSDGGFYLPRFQALQKDLEALRPVLTP
jgi:hypothetical protein